MQIDRAAVNKLLSLNDFQLRIVIKRLLRENGIDAESLNIDTRNITAIRRALENATEDDIKRFSEMLGGIGGRK